MVHHIQVLRVVGVIIPEPETVKSGSCKIIADTFLKLTSLTIYGKLQV